MAKVVLHGELAEKFRDEYNLDVKSPNEAVRCLCLMVPGFKNTFKEGAYYLYVANDKDIFNIDEDNVRMSVPGDIHIMPEIVGSKKKGLGKALFGIALIGLAFVPGVNLAIASAAYGITGSVGATFAAAGLIHSALVTVGLGLALGGASALLSPKVKASSDEDKNQSFLFHGSDVNIDNGSCVPIIYGEVLAGGFVISQEVQNADINVVTGDAGYDASIGGWTYTQYPTYLP